MDIHKNARLLLVLRVELVEVVIEQGFNIEAGCGPLQREREDGGQVGQAFPPGGRAGAAGRSSRPRSNSRRTLAERVLALRRLRYAVHRIATALELSPATVCRILRQHRLNQAATLEPPPPAARYEHRHLGDLIHFDIKPLARIAANGWSPRPAFLSTNAQ